MSLDLVGPRRFLRNRLSLGDLVGARLLSGNRLNLGDLVGARLLSGNRLNLGDLVGARRLSVNRSSPRDPVGPRLLLLLTLGIALLAAGCRSHRGDDAKSGPEVIYARAQKAMKNSSYGEAIKQLETLQSRFPFSEPARQAQLDLIYAYYKSRQTDPAIDAADTFIRENPTNVRVDYAYYMKGLVYFERQANALERFFRVDLSKRPPINARKSFEAFEELIKKYPHSPYIGDARQRMIFLRNRLADFELNVALYYMRRGAYVGALDRAKFCVENYDGAPAVRGSLKVMVDAYRNLHMTDLATDAERVYDANYPGYAGEVAEKKSWWRRIL